MLQWHSSLACALAALCLAAILAACGNNEPRQEITQVEPATPEDQAVRDLATAERMRVGPGENPGNQLPPMASQQSEAGPGFHWDVPAGWEEIEPTPLRVANLQVAGNPEAECYFSVLGGDGGGLAENLNRWRKQMNQPPLSAEEVAALPEKTLLNQPAKYVVIDGAYSGMSGGPGKEGYRLIGLALIREGQAAFVKMTGPASVLETEAAKFDEFAASIHPEDEPHAEEETPTPIEAPDDSAARVAPAAELDPTALKWTAPSSWSQGGDKPMRLVTFVVSNSECYVTVLPGAAGGAEQNINRWQQQMGKPVLTPEEIAALPMLSLLGQQAPFVTVTGSFSDMQGVPHENQMLLGTICTVGGQSVFIKMTGPEAEVAAELDNFKSFCASIHV